MTNIERRPPHNFFEALKAEHCELVGVLGSVRHELVAGTLNELKMDELVTQMCDRIEQHFLAEEDGGYLHDVLEKSPGLTLQAKKLHQQHESLLTQARNLREAVHLVTSHEADRSKFQGEFESFANALMTHEAQEDDLMQKASCGPDLGRSTSPAPSPPGDKSGVEYPNHSRKAK